jgi:alkanesulfonate monooxygenase SsuD/methylene tetrahydromethanopterin reductase-like flavin-dependent oxidoreductase (luciferase family)
VRIGVAVGLSGASFDPDTGLEPLLEAVDESGVDTLWSLENPLADQPEPLTWLGWSAALRPNLSIGTAALIAPIREPILLARQLLTLDRLTNGRLWVGLTIGRREDDYLLTGTDFATRGRRLEDVIAVVRACGTGQPVEVSGSTGEWTAAAVGLAPSQSGSPPLLVGGQADRALRRAAEIGDGYLGGATSGPDHAIAAVPQLRELLERSQHPDRPFHLVTNVFVQLGDTVTSALDVASSTLAARHGGHMPYDPADVVVAGPAQVVAERLGAVVDAGYQGVNLVPVTMDLPQIAALGEVVRDLRGAAR